MGPTEHGLGHVTLKRPSGWLDVWVHWTWYHGSLQNPNNSIFRGMEVGQWEQEMWKTLSMSSAAKKSKWMGSSQRKIFVKRFKSLLESLTNSKGDPI